MNRWQHRIWTVIFIITLVGIGAGSAVLSVSEPQWVPLSPESSGLMLQNALISRMLPYRVESNGLQLIVERLLDWAIDWQQGQFTIKCAFTAGTSGSLLQLSQTGAITLTGTVLFSAPEQKVGFRLFRIDSLELDHTAHFLSESARVVLNRGLAGKELWSGTPPQTSQILTDANFSKLLEMVISRQLPLVVNDGKSSITMNRIEEIAFLTEPGTMQVKFDVQGVYHKIFNWKFDGGAQVKLRVEVDPLQLAGVVRMESLTDLQLKGVPFWIDHWIRGLINSRIRGQVFRFDWE